MKVMSYDDAEHFYAWLEKTVHEGDQYVVEQQIHAILKDHPTLISEGKSWPEMRRMAEASYPRESFF